MKEITNRFFRYVKIDTQSDPNSTSYPSTDKQYDLLNLLKEELEEFNIEVILDEYGYIMATIPSNLDYSVPTIGFIAHVDTAPDLSGKNVSPQIFNNYDGSDIKLNDEYSLKVEDNPELKDYIGQSIITTDGTTLLGADDKAGITVIMEAVKAIVNDESINHGEIKIGFTPDEEVGQGSKYFDVEKFGADFAYTIDGCKIGELQYENFNAASCDIQIQGRVVHPGNAKNKMINAIEIVRDLDNLVPLKERPQYTSGYEGFYHLYNLEGGVDYSKIQYIIRDHCHDKFEQRKKNMENIVKEIEVKYPGAIIYCKIVDSYFNMEKIIKENMKIINIAEQAMKDANITPIKDPIRGGTDGARLTYLGLPCPNIFTGAHNLHGRFEYVPVESMEKAQEVILNIIKIVSKKD